MIARLVIFICVIVAGASVWAFPNFEWLALPGKFSILFSVMGAAGLVRLARGFQFPEFRSLPREAARDLVKRSKQSIYGTAWFVVLVFITFVLTAILSEITIFQHAQCSALEVQKNTESCVWKFRLAATISNFLLIFTGSRFILLIVRDVQLHDEQIEHLDKLAIDDRVVQSSQALETKAFGSLTPTGYGSRVDLPN
jgi:hypothetical protein